jgi:1,2-diacylglycerol 3-alpha-glucosyltransferase
MRIGIFTDTYYPQINGVAISIGTLEKALIARGHKVYIITTTDADAPKSSGNVLRLPSVPFIFSPQHRMTYMYPPSTINKIRKLNLDIIHTHTEFPIGILGKLCSFAFNVPNVHTFHTMYHKYTHYIAGGKLIGPKTVLKYIRFFCNRSAAVTIPGKSAKAVLHKSGVHRPIIYIPNGQSFSNFDTARYTEQDIADVRAEMGIAADAPVVVSVTRVAKEKSIDVAIRQMLKLRKAVPNVKYLIVGDGPELDNLKALTKKLKLTDTVVFAGSRPWAEICKYFMAGNLFTTASVSETQGLTNYEAMMAKVPVVARYDASNSNAITNGLNGYLYNNDDEAVEYMRRILTDKELAEGLALHGYNSVKFMSDSAVTAKMERLYKKIICSR